MEKTMEPQSAAWGACTLRAPAEEWSGPARLLAGRDGSTIVYEIVPDPSAELLVVLPFSFDGNVTVIEGSAALALVSKGKWSGGQNWRGWILGRTGALICADRKGAKMYYRATETGWQREAAKPAMEEVL